MFKLMKLELEKKGGNELLKHGIAIFCMGLACFGLLFLMFQIETIVRWFASLDLASTKDILEAQLESGQLTDKMALVNTLMGLTFIIYGAVNYAKYVVKGIKTKELQEMFLYPISRTKILYSKVLLGFLFTAIGYIIVKVLLLVIFGLLGFSELLTVWTLIQTVVDAAVIGLLGLVGMLIGIWRKSTITTIVSGILAGAILFGQTNINFTTNTMFTLASVPFLLYVLAFVVGIATYYTLNKLKDQDFLE